MSCDRVLLFIICIATVCLKPIQIHGLNLKLVLARVNKLAGTVILLDNDFCLSFSIISSELHSAIIHHTISLHDMSTELDPCILKCPNLFKIIAKTNSEYEIFGFSPMNSHTTVK